MNRMKLAVAATAGLAVAAGGVAVAATQLGSAKQESQAVVNDAAGQLGIEPSRLSAALKKALSNRVDEAVAAGRLTKAEGDRMKQAISAGDFPLFFAGPRGFHRDGPGFGDRDHGRRLEPAAAYLDLTRAEIEAQLATGKTLAQLAKDKGKSVDGLIGVLVADAERFLEEARKAGRITQAQENEILAEQKQRIAAFVNGRLLERRGFRGGFRDRGDATFGADV